MTNGRGECLRLSKELKKVRVGMKWFLNGVSVISILPKNPVREEFSVVRTATRVEKTDQKLVVAGQMVLL